MPNDFVVEQLLWAGLYIATALFALLTTIAGVCHFLTAREENQYEQWVLSAYGKETGQRVLEKENRQ